MQRRSGARRTGIAALALAAAVLAVPSAGATDLLPHRAVYDLTLGEQNQGAGIAALRGRMVYEISGGPCEGYSVAFRFVTQVSDESGGQRVTDLQTSSYEDAAGESFQFLSKTFVNRKLSEEIRGKAHHAGERIAIELKMPEEKGTDISGKALFPIDHLRRLITAAESGEKIFAADIFDGSDTGDKVYETTAVIGSRRAAPDAGDMKDDGDAPKAVAAIGDLPHWPVTISYFENDAETAGEGLPVYQLSFLLYSNGVNRRLVLDYGDFTLNGTLSEFIELDPVPCGN